MYIYKITVLPINQVYIGFDTKPSYKLSRWKTHLRDAHLLKTKLQCAISKYGKENCQIEILHDNVKSLGELVQLEIHCIESHNSYQSGLNSSQGGDGLGIHDLSKMTMDEFNILKKTLSDRLTDYNNNVKWANLSSEERKQKIAKTNTHSPEVSKRRAQTLRQYYKLNPEAKEKKRNVIQQWRQDNPDLLSVQNKKASAIAAKVNSRKLKVQCPDGTIKFYDSRKAFKEDVGMDCTYIMKKTKLGLDHKGYKLWDAKDDI